MIEALDEIIFVSIEFQHRRTAARRKVSFENAPAILLETKMMSY